MNRCYQHGCTKPARNRIVLAAPAGWRRWLHRPARSWQVCDEHRMDPISRRHAGQLHHV
jgi:hypothetical protein